MIPFQERKKLRKILYSKVTLVALAVMFFLMSVGAWKIHQKALIAKTERDIAGRAFVDLTSRAKELEISLRRLKSEQGIEEEVRQKYMVVRQGEEVVVIVDENAKKSENGETLAPSSLWQRIVSFFRL